LLEDFTWGREFVWGGKRRKEHLGRNVLIPMQDYKFLHVAVMICVTLVNTLLTGYTIGSAGCVWPGLACLSVIVAVSC